MATDTLMSVDEWRRLDALSPAAANEAIRTCCSLNVSDFESHIENLKNALAAGCANRDREHSRSYFRVQQIALAMFLKPELMKDVALDWLCSFAKGRKTDDGVFTPYVSRDSAFAHLLEMAASATGPGGAMLFGIVAQANDGLGWMAKHQFCVAMEKAVEAGNAEVIHELLGRGTIYDHDNPLPTMDDPRDLGFVRVTMEPQINLLTHAAKNIVELEGQENARVNVRIRQDRMAAFAAVQSHLAPGYAEPYYEMFDWMSNNVQKTVASAFKSVLPNAAVCLALGATPRPGKAKQDWARLLRVKIIRGRPDLGETTAEMPFSHLLVDSPADAVVPDALRRLANEAGLDVNQTTKAGITLLMRAASQNKVEIVDTLLDLGANASLTVSKIDRKDPGRAYDAAAMAETSGNFELAARLRAHVAREAILSVAAAAKGAQP